METPALFDPELAYQEVLDTINSINKGTAADEAFCRCSQFPAIDLIRMGMRGELFAGISKANPEALARKIVKFREQERFRALLVLTSKPSA
jgi:hypothetical protein